MCAVVEVLNASVGIVSVLALAQFGQVIVDCKIIGTRISFCDCGCAFKICAGYKIKHLRIHDFETISYCADIHRLRLWAQFEHVRMKAATLLARQLTNALAQRTCGQWRRATRQHKEGLPLR
jgi:hypothetical protein